MKARGGGDRTHTYPSTGGQILDRNRLSVRCLATGLTEHDEVAVRPE